MCPTPFGIIVGLSTIAILTSTCANVFAIEFNSASGATSNFTNNLMSKINKLISEAANDTNNILNSTSFLKNGSNQTLNQIVTSNNKVVSSIINTGSGSTSNSMIKDQVTTINGVCNSIKVGGNGNDTIFSSGNCNDELTGGSGADKFTCGEGEDTIKDYNSKEGDVILDKQNCEKIQ
jgi:Ca2+-binding RTX toxin-like protein